MQNIGQPCWDALNGEMQGGGGLGVCCCPVPLLHV